MGMFNVFCPQCGAENLPGPSKCSNCGGSLSGAGKKPLPQVKCLDCGALNVGTRDVCHNCGKELSSAKLMAPPGKAPRLKQRSTNAGMFILLLLSLLAAAAGFVSLSEATAGVGGIALAILLAVYARIAQAGHLHDRAEQHLEHVAKQPQPK